uniref:Uncharacterized protein n=1 Tax=Palpitomonas bilix TaxID=652834 RepID=A0A7S3LST7_9EUKA
MTFVTASPFTSQQPHRASHVLPEPPVQCACIFMCVFCARVPVQNVTRVDCVHRRISMAANLTSSLAHFFLVPLRAAATASSCSWSLLSSMAAINSFALLYKTFSSAMLATFFTSDMKSADSSFFCVSASVERAACSLSSASFQDLTADSSFSFSSLL